MQSAQAVCRLEHPLAEDYYDNDQHAHYHEPFVITLFGPWTHLLKALSPFHSVPCVVSNSPHHRHQINRTWQSRASILVINFLHHVAGPLHFTGRALEWFLNFIYFNGGLLKVFLNLGLCRLDCIIWCPPKDSPSYYSVVGWLGPTGWDPRLDLIDPAAKSKESNTQSFIDLCAMASKLAYESQEVQKHVLGNRWNMCFKKFYDCWNDRAELNTTEAFIFIDKQENANLVFVAFRGTEPFDANDWSTDFDFSWFELDPEVGKIHIGFLEALGLVNRKQLNTFDWFKQNCLINLGWKHHVEHVKLTTGLTNSKVVGDKLLAFDVISQDLGKLLLENPKAKLFLTGHSLGGALAILFAAILMYKKNRDEKEEKILESLSAIHTFGQPRVGDIVFSNFMNKNMKALNIDYYRIVYCNDMVSRIPFDDNIFGFKHVGHICYYYDSLFRVQTLEAEPNKNYFSPFFAIGMWFNAIWELVQAVVLTRLRYGSGFQEAPVMIMLRILGLVVPGLSAHLLVNYVNAVRLGPQILDDKLGDMDN